MDPAHIMSQIFCLTCLQALHLNQRHFLLLFVSYPLQDVCRILCFKSHGLLCFIVILHLSFRWHQHFSRPEKSGVFSIVQIQSNNWNIPQGCHKLVYIACVHNLLPSEIHKYINLRYFMLRVNAMMIWIRINPFNIHIMYKKDKHLLTLQCFLFWQQVSLPYVTVLLSFFSSLYYVDEIGYYWLYNCTRKLIIIFRIDRASSYISVSDINITLMAYYRDGTQF